MRQGIEEPAKYRNWAIHFTDRESMEVVTAPPVSHSQVLAIYPDAVAAVPCGSVVPEPMHSGERTEITRWLKQIGEDAAGIATILDGIPGRTGAKGCFLKRARGGWKVEAG